jgi:hypothetical protein
LTIDMWQAIYCHFYLFYILFYSHIFYHVIGMANASLLYKSKHCPPLLFLYFIFHLYLFYLLYKFKPTIPFGKDFKSFY